MGRGSGGGGRGGSGGGGGKYSKSFGVNPNGGDVYLKTKSNQSLINPYGEIVVPASRFEGYAANVIGKGYSIIKVAQGTAAINSEFGTSAQADRAYRRKRGSRVGL